MQERRNEQRWPAYLGGLIVFDGRVSTVQCLIRNTSASGARLVIDPTVLLPSEFSLQIPRRNTEERVRMRWRQRDDVGIERVTEAPSDDLAMMRQIKRLETQNAELARRIADLTEPSS